MRWLPCGHHLRRPHQIHEVLFVWVTDTCCWGRERTRDHTTYLPRKKQRLIYFVLTVKTAKMSTGDPFTGGEG